MLQPISTISNEAYHNFLKYNAAPFDIVEQSTSPIPNYLKLLKTFNQAIIRSTTISLNHSPKICLRKHPQTNCSQILSKLRGEPCSRRVLNVFPVPAWSLHSVAGVRVQHAVTFSMCESECVAEDAREGSAERGNDWSFLLFANCTGWETSPAQDIRHLIWFLDYTSVDRAERNTVGLVCLPCLPSTSPLLTCYVSLVLPAVKNNTASLLPSNLITKSMIQGDTGYRDRMRNYVLIGRQTVLLAGGFLIDCTGLEINRGDDTLSSGSISRCNDVPSRECTN